MAETLTTLGIGEALVTVLGSSGAPTPPFATRLIPPASRMGPLGPAELAARLSTPQVRRYAEAVDRESAEEKLARRRQEAEPEAPARGGRAARDDSSFSQILNSPLARTVAGAVTRGLMGAILGPARRRRRY